MLTICENRISILRLADDVRRRMDGCAKLSDEYVYKLCIETVLADCSMRLQAMRHAAFYVRQVFCTLRCELEILQDLADDPELTEIMVNGPDSIFIEKNGRVKRSSAQFETREQLERVIQRLATSVGKELNDLNPIVDARLSDGSRINAVHSNIAIDGPILTIRRFNKSRMSMEDLIRQGDITKDAASFVKNLVEAGYNIFVSGGTSSGKTTFLNIISDYIPKTERIVVIEDSAELMIRGHENLVRMEAKAANAQGKGEITIRDLIKSSLRMRPDRVIVGEVRGGEVIDMVAAMSTGHDGSLSTGHANSARGMLRRLEAMYLAESNYPIEAVRGQLSEALEILIHLQRDADGHRRVIEISEFEGYEDAEPIIRRLYEYSAEAGLCKTGEELRRKDKLQRVLSC